MSSKVRGVTEKPTGSGIWWINYYDAEGRRHREKIGKKSIAIEAYFHRRAEIREGKFKPPRIRRVSFRELAELALEDKRIRLEPNSYNKDVERMKYLTKEFGDMPADLVTPGQVEAFLLKLRDSGQRKAALSGSTLNKFRALLSSVFTFAVRTGKLVANPVARVRQFKQAQHRIRFLDAAEEKALREKILAQSTEHEAEFDLALHTGIRRGEQFSLKWENVDLERGVLTVGESLSARKTGRRHVPINAVARRALEVLYPASNGSAFVCENATRVGMQDWRRWFEDAVKEAGIDNFKYHDLRHTFASRLAMKGVPIASIQELLGHRSIVTTMRYAHLSPDFQKENVERLVENAEPNGHVTGTCEEKPIAEIRKVVQSA